MNENEIKTVVEATIKELDIIHKRTTQPNLQKEVVKIILSKLNKKQEKSIQYSKQDQFINESSEKADTNSKRI